MTFLSRRFLTGVSAIVLFAAGAQAADYDPPIVIERAPEYVPVEIGNGWYLRGDIGYTLGTSAKGAVGYRTFDGVSYGSGQFATSDFDDTYTLGIGIGYQFNSWLRADATLEMQKNDFDGTTASSAPCGGAPIGTTCRTEESSQARSYTFLANVYGDLGTYAGFTPYVGAGAGIARVQWEDLSSATYCIDGGVACGVNFLGTTAHPGEASWRFTYALMAGIAYDVSRNLKIDLGYKYRHIAGGDMFGFDAASVAAGATGTQGKDEGFSQHEVKVGLRYSLW